MNQHWTCPNCNHDNNPDATLCEKCQCAQPGFGEQDLSQSQDFFGDTVPGQWTPIRPNTISEFSQFSPETLYGCTLKEDGTGDFRVWAPNADAVHVIGDFNAWNHESDRLQKGPNGVWFGHVQNVQHTNHYKYIIDSKGKKLFRNDPRALVLRYRGDAMDSLVWDNSYDWKHDDFVCPPLSSLVLYCFHVGSFGESSKGKRDGTFKSCIKRLDHLVELGVNAIELLPISQDEHATCWGYDPISLFAIQREFGTPNDLKYFIDECHARNLAVITDWVPNHMALQCVMENWDTEEEGSLGCYFYQKPEDRTTDFGPRLDYANEGVRDWLKNSLYCWLVDFRFDGVRVDSTITMRKTSDGRHLREAWTLLQELTALARVWGKNKILIAEDLQSNEDMHTVAGFDAQWDCATFYLLYGITKAINDGDRDMNLLRQVIERPVFLHHGHARIVFTENHDTVPKERENRVPRWMSESLSVYSIKRSTLIGAIILTIPGTPMLLQGQEILENDENTWPNPPGIDWGLKSKHQGIYDLYKDVIALRRNLGNVTSGLIAPYVKITHINHNDKVIVYHRFLTTGPTDDVIVIVNFSNKSFKKYSFGVPRPGEWKVRFNSDEKRYSEKFEGIGGEVGHTYKAAERDYDGRFETLEVQIARYAMIVLSQDPLIVPHAEPPQEAQ